MDSGNSSGSMQSSNAGDNDGQDFDSKSNSSNFLMNSIHSPHFASLISPPHQNQNPSLFHLQQQNLDHHHATTQYSIDDTNHHHDPIWAAMLPPYSTYPATNSPNFSPLPPPPPSSKTAQSPGPSSSNPKKRTRASRRAPTTVLTTDTANFRQMVQEFTGIPAGPFSASQTGPNLLSLGPLYPPLIRPSPLKPSSATNMVAINRNNATTSINNDDNPLSGDGRRFLNMQPKPQLAGAMNIGNLSGSFLSRPENPITSARNDDDDNVMIRRWRSQGKTVVGTDGNDRVQENNLVGFDGNIMNNSESQLHVSGYNLNLAEKGMENVSSSSVAEGAVASWICPTSH